MPIFTDQLNRRIDLPAAPQRIISLVPSQTELLFDLGLDARVVGITKFCINPGSWFRTKTRVGGTKNIDHKLVRRLNPDLIIANKEENTLPDIKTFEAYTNVYVSDVNDLESAKVMIDSIGSITDCAGQSAKILARIDEEFRRLQAFSAQCRKLRAAYFIWKDPYLVAGKNTFIDNMLARCGIVNVVSKTRYPEVKMLDDDLKTADIFLLSSEPFPFEEKHVADFIQQFPGKPVALVDGEMFSWYGSRLQKSPEYFFELIGRLQTLTSTV